MRDREPKTLREEGQPADRGLRFECPQFPGLRECTFARGPGDCAVRAERDVIDPAIFRIARQYAGFAIGDGRDDAAVVAAADDAGAIGGAGEDGAAVGGDAPGFALRRHEHDGFVTKDQGGGAAEKVRLHDAAAGSRDGPCAFDDGRCVAVIVGHRS